jgi:hypothetical protein
MALSSYCLWCLKVMTAVDHEDCCILRCDMMSRSLQPTTRLHSTTSQNTAVFMYWLLWIMDILKLRHLISFFFSVDVSFSQTCTWIQPATKAQFTLHCITTSHLWKTNINITGKDKLAQTNYKHITIIIFVSSHTLPKPSLMILKLMTTSTMIMISNMHWREKNRVDSDISSVRKAIGA